MRDVVIVEAVRTPIGKRNGGLSTMHAADVLGVVQHEVVDRSGIDPMEIGQVVGGCVMQAGMQAMNVTRNAWLGAGLPLEVAAMTVDTQCGSSQQATGLAAALVGAGLVDVAMACGVELMSCVPMGSTTRDKSLGRPVNKSYREHYEWTTQFEGSERMADRWGISRADCDAFGKLSQDRAAAAWAAGRFKSQVLPIVVPDVDEQGNAIGSTHVVEADEAIRDTTLEGLASLKPSGRPDGVHTAGTSSQIADGAAAILMMTRNKAATLGLEPLATVIGSCLVGCDPVPHARGADPCDPAAPRGRRPWHRGHRRGRDQ